METIGVVTASVTTQPPWRPTWPRPDGGREHLVAMVTCLGCNTPPVLRNAHMQNLKESASQRAKRNSSRGEFPCCWR
ncbi:hypothetical protein XENOCAPTIV_016213 [Xenoophorus captivus]|uniref:Uncharacterized protein n=1 Tax=Xenoophorus captivus TaxID=1517983 RepID=A0ABV0QS49_9TELE